MNEKYLSRGKRKDNGAWIEGFYSCDIWDDETEYILYDGQEYEVIPETVGQYTGLKDKIGKLIFEGDIIRTKKYGRVIAHSTASDYDIFRITYVPAVFRLENIHRAFNLVGNSADYEVIGNIHDNPELLEVER